MKILFDRLILALAFVPVATPARAQSAAELKATIDSLRAEVAQLRADVAVGKVGGAANVVNGDLTVNGRLCLPTCRSDVTAAIQIRAQGDAEIALESKLGGSSSQGAASHGSIISFDSDGGLRLIHNFRHARNPDGSPTGVWVEPEKPRTIIAFDSQGTPSISQDRNGYFYPSQSLVINFDEARKVIWLESMKAGWKWGFCASPRVDSNCENSYYTVPTP
jgi:hypothetical protein